MTVTGVTTYYGYPPESLGELPAAFCLPPSSGLGDYVVSCIDQNKTRSMGYVICLEAAGQDQNEENYDLYAPAMDNLESALDTALGTVANFHQYEITAGSFEVAGISYWALTATITIRSV